MLQEDLTPCATLLYQWIVRKIANRKNNILKFDMRDFQAWSAEFRDFPYSEQEILLAFKQLKQFELLSVTEKEVTVRAKNWNTSKEGRVGLIYLKYSLLILLAVGLFGILKFTSYASNSTRLKMLPNLKPINSGLTGGK